MLQHDFIIVDVWLAGYRAALEIKSITLTVNVSVADKTNPILLHSVADQG
jgi:hypothetical protein